MSKLRKKIGIAAIFVLCFSLILFCGIKLGMAYSVNAEQNGTDTNEGGNGNVPADGEKKYDPVSINLYFEKTIDGDAKGYDRDMSINQFAFRMTDDDGTQTETIDILLPRDTPEEDDPDTPFPESPGKPVVKRTYDTPGTHKIKVREISPAEGLTDDEGRPMPEDTPGMQYDTNESETLIVVKEEDGKLQIYIEEYGRSTQLGDGSFIPVGDFDNITSTPKVRSAVTKINGQTEEVVFKQGEEYTVTSDVELEKLAEGEVYRVESLLFKDYEPFDTVVSEVTSDDPAFKITFPKKATEADVYRVVTILYKGEERLNVYNGDFGMWNDVTLKAPREIPPEDPTVTPTESETDPTTDSTDASTSESTDPGSSSESGESKDSSSSSEEKTSGSSEKSGRSKTSNADTGDKVNTMPLIITIAAAAGGIAVTTAVVAKRKK